MAAALVGGAALGAVFQELLKAILKLGERAINFNPVLKDITFKVNAIIPLVKEIDELNEVMDYPRSETEILRNLIVNANNLFLQCGGVEFGKLDYVKRPFYTEKLRELDASIRSFMDILLLQMVRDQKKNFKLVNQMMEIICRIDGDGRLLKMPIDLFVPPCLVPEIRDESIGLIVRGCKRFPLALKIVAKQLSGSALSVWKVKEREWSRESSILSSETELLKCLKSSFDAVSDNKMIIKECFMDLGSFPEDQRIHVATVIDMCAALYDQDECEAMYILDELSTRTLINSIALRNETRDEDCHNESYFTQHDIESCLSI